MSAPVFLAENVSTDRLVLTGPEGHHAAGVHRLQVGEAADLVDGRGARASCVVVAVGRDTVELEVLRRITEPLATPRLVLVQALAKGDRGELAVELATEVGVDEVLPWCAERCVVRWEGDRGERALARWRSTARAAAKQSRRSWVPEIAAAQTTRQVADRLQGAFALVLHESATSPLSAVQLPTDGAVILVVGPEGGLTENEVQAFEAAGAVTVRLGQSVLRTSTAGAAAAAVVSALTPRWR